MEPSISTAAEFGWERCCPARAQSHGPTNRKDSNTTPSCKQGGSHTEVIAEMVDVCGWLMRFVNTLVAREDT